MSAGTTFHLVRPQIPGGETMLNAQMRGMAVLWRLRAQLQDTEVVLVSHGDVIKAVLAHVLAVPLDLFARIEIAPGSRSEVVIYDSDARILGVNLPPGA
jgi:probable phosphoglycerate mutase